MQPQQPSRNTMGEVLGTSLGPAQRAQYSLYGGAKPFILPHSTKMPFEQRRNRVRIDCLLICFFVPCAQFALVMGVLSSLLHYLSPWLTWLVVLACAILTLACCSLAIATLRNWFRGDVGRQPFWYVFLAFTMVVSFGFSAFFGEANWWNNTLPYTGLQNLSFQPSVNVAKASGRQLMDVGRIEFQNGTEIDVTKATFFKNLDQFCVAPITIGTEPLRFYDFWVVGLNCCGDQGFRCGDYRNPSARSGLRLLRQDQRNFYQLAVQQAEATYNIKANHPLFFFWMQDSLAGMEEYESDARKYFFLGLFTFSACQLFLMSMGLVYKAFV